MPLTRGIDHTEIRQELNHILSHPQFHKSPILSRFLRFVVEKTLDGSANQIKEYTVGRSVLDKPHSFNPQTDASVRIHAIRLRKLLEEYYQENPSENKVRISLPKGAYCPSFENLDSGNVFQTSKKEIKTTVAKDVLPADSICVIPFNGFMPDNLPDFSLDGFCSFLSELLSKFQDISVKSYYSVIQYLNKGGELAKLGSALDVTYYLTGDVEIEGNTIHVDVSLFDAKSNTLIWSEDFLVGAESGALSNTIHGISNQIVASLAGYSGVMHFKKFLSVDQVSGITNTDAKAVFWFYHYLVQQNNPTFQKALSQLEQAVLENPDSSLCWAVLSMLYTDSVFFNYPTKVENPLARSQAYVARALSLNPNCQHGNISAGWINILLRNKEVALFHLEKSYSINPNAPYFSAACCLGMALVGEYDKSKLYWKKTAPLHPMPYWWLIVPPVFLALKDQDYKHALFIARKIGTPAGIQEHIFEMIALYYLDDKQALESCVKAYLLKHPYGIDHAIQSWPMIVFDDDLVEKITHALKEINRLKEVISLK